MEQSDILRNLRIEQLTPMQEAARDAYQSDKDLVLLSPTGSGKTLAFLLPLVHFLFLCAVDESCCRWCNRSKPMCRAYRRWCSYRRASLPCR